MLNSAPCQNCFTVHVWLYFKKIAVLETSVLDDKRTISHLPSTLIKEASLSVLDEADESSDEFTHSLPVQLAPLIHHSEDEVDSGAKSHDDTHKNNPAPATYYQQIRCQQWVLVYA